MTHFTRSKPSRTFVSIALAVALVATACSSEKDETGTAAAEKRAGTPIESGLPPASAEPVRGGQLVYGLEAESASYCMPESQLAISGMQVARALYDPLVVPNGKGGYSPYLAKAVTHSDDYKTWTIALRSGIKFHNGEAFNAQAVKDNLDAYRVAKSDGHERNGLLFRFVLQDIDTVTTTNDLTVQVAMKQPWVAFDSILYSGGRLVMIAPEQLMADDETCGKLPIGTGPFKLISWQHEVALKAERWPNYWQKAPDGKPFPYADAIEFRPMPNSDARIAALQQGDLNLMHTSTSADIAANLTRLRDDNALNLLISEVRTETGYFMLNSSPENRFGATFAKQDARVAVAQAIDRVKLNQLVNRGYPELADGPFAPDVMGHLDKPGFPKYDLEAAKKAVAKMKADGRDTRIDLLSSVSLQSIRLANIARTMLEQAGFEVVVDVTGEADLIGRAIGGDYEMVVFRNQPGDDPDANRIWWRSDSPLNFGKFKDDVIDKNLDTGRTKADPAVRKTAYEAVNRQMTSQAYNIYLWFQPWAVALATNVHNVVGPTLPDGAEPSARLATGHSLLGLWIDPADE